MPSKKYAVGACAVLFAAVSASSNASNKTYTVHKGDTVGTIAHRFHVAETALEKKNGLGHKTLKAGMTLQIPGAPAHSAEYTVKEGDNDWVIAHHLGVSIAELRDLNPDADWKSLQIGDTLKVPGKANPETPKFKSRYAVVSADSATIRRGPSQDADKVTTVDTGTKVTVLNYQHGWYELKFPKGTVGWMRGDLLSQVSAPKSAVASKTVNKKVLAAKGKAKLLAKASHKPAPHYVMPTSNPDSVAMTMDGKGVPAMSGLVEKQPVATVAKAAPKTKHHAKSKPTEVAYDLQPSGAEPTTSRLLKRAYGLRGTRYIWGGLSSRGLDCSGFTTTVFRSVGIKLPRTSRSQSTIGQHVGRGQLRQGDLVFFATHGSNHINHVGMYIGDNKFIHASSGAGRVRVDNLGGYYGKRLQTARRVATVQVDDDTPAALPVDPRPGRHSKKATVAAVKPKTETADKSDKSDPAPAAEKPSLNLTPKLGENKVTAPEIPNP